MLCTWTKFKLTFLTQERLGPLLTLYILYKNTLKYCVLYLTYKINMHLSFTVYLYDKLWLTILSNTTWIDSGMYVYDRLYSLHLHFTFIQLYLHYTFYIKCSVESTLCILQAYKILTNNYLAKQSAIFGSNVEYVIYQNIVTSTIWILLYINKYEVTIYYVL